MIRIFFMSLALMAMPESALAQAAEKVEPSIRWIINCASSSKSIALSCSMSQRITQPRTGQVVITVSIQSHSRSGVSAILLSLAHGFYIADGLKLQVDDEAPVKLPFHRSSAKGLATAMPLSEGLLNSMLAGKVLNVTASGYDPRKDVTFPISLSGFSVAYAKMISIR